MKSLRQLLRRRSQSSTKRRTQGETKRRLSTQTLEQRQMLAGDVNTAHNSLFPYDVNQDFKLSPIDALGVINHLSSTRALGEQVENDDPFGGKKVDVNNDGNVTPADALTVINALSRGEEMPPPLVELFLTARDHQDNLLPVVDGVVQAPGTGIENSFFLEAAYEDFRTFGADTGLFSFFPDIEFSRGGLLSPVMREVQQIVIDKTIRESTSGGITLTLEGTSQSTFISLSDLQNDSRGAYSDALVALGYSTDEFKLSEPDELKQTTQENGQTRSNVVIQIQYLGDIGNQDMPDIMVTNEFDNMPPIDFNEFSPVNPDGSLNFDALKLNLDASSRTLNDGDEAYNFLPRANFDPDAGFTDTGALAFATSGGIRGLDDDNRLEEPFDAFAIEVFFNTPVSNSAPLVVDINRGEGIDPLLLFDTEENVPEDQVITDEDARVTISTGAVGVNNPPTVSGPIVLTVGEDDNNSTEDLLAGASDLDGDTLSVANFSFTGGSEAGVSVSGNDLLINPAAYNSLQAGASETITASYDIVDGNGGSVSQTLTLTVNGANDAPDAGADITSINDEFDASFNIDLLQNASDPDGDTLDVINITQVGSEDTSGVTPDDNNNQLIVNPGAYAFLNDGESITVVYDFEVTDGNGGSDTARVSVTINGDTPNQPLVVGDPLTLTLTEDASGTTLDLTDNVTDPDPEDTINVTAGTVNVSGDDSGITLNGNILTIDPSAYNSLADGEQTVVTYTYEVNDGEGSTGNHSATVTITGVNDAPVVVSAVTQSFGEDDAAGTVNLLAGASDPDTNDTINIDSLTLRSGDASGITDNGSNGLNVDPSAYNSLAVGETATIIYDYNVVDGNGGSTAQSATITITGVNDAPIVGNAITASASEDDSVQSVDLLQGASDPDATDSLSVANFSVTSGDSTPFSVVNDQTLTFDPSFFNSLAVGETAVMEATYDVVDGNGGQTQQSVTVTITGANDAPIVGDALSFSFTEDDAQSIVSLLDNTSDPDTNDTLNAVDISITGVQDGISVNGSSVTVTPSAYSDLVQGESEVITFTYNVSDGTETVAHSATITITGADDTPKVTGPITVTFNENDGVDTVDLLAGATDPNNDPLSVINATVVSGDAKGVTIDAANNRLLVDPSAYRDMEDGETEVITIDYQITDTENNTVDQTVTVTIIGQTIVLSNVSGQLWVDHIENIDEVLAGADPIRNGVKEDDEQSLGGVTVRLLEVTTSGETQVATTMTNNEGDYEFTGLLPGTYFVEYDLPESVQFTGSRRGQIVIGEEGGANASGPALNAIGLVGVLHRLDLLAKSYIAAGIIDTGGSPEGLSGGSVVLNADGSQQMFVAGEGFDAQYAEVVLNDARDAALLTIVNSEGSVMSARLTLEQFVVAGDGEGVRFFGDMDDFDFFASSDDLVKDEFEDYRNAIDRAIATGI